MKYSHQWVTLAEKYEMQKPAKSIKLASHKDYLDSTGGNTLLLMRASKLKTSQADTMNYEARALRDCTFSPQINALPNEKRTLQQFLRAQEDHLERTKSKLETLRREQSEAKISEMKSSNYKSLSPKAAFDKLYQDAQRIKEKLD